MLESDSTVPLGLCQCGCGRPTNIARDSIARYGHVRGQPFRFLAGHSRRLTTASGFWARVDQSGGPASCWPWTGPRDRDGYGVTGIERLGERRAHRVAWFLQNGAIPAGLVVCHSCDNPLCCNPAHLFTGTTRDNVMDCIRKGRRPTGEQSRQAKLTDADLAVVWSLLDAKVPQTVIAARFGVCQATIGHIKTGRNRKGQRPTPPEH